MSQPSENASAQPEREIELPYRRERAQYHTLLLANPNYFGNIDPSPFQPVLKIISDTTYEELVCVGFNPALDLLQATVHIKLPFGYLGNLCAAGSTEYVRFYVDYGAGWEDAGTVAFNVHDIPNSFDCARHRDKPLSYVVTLPIEPRRDPCGRPLLPNVHAILSWQSVPVLGTPPIWGNELDHHIQIRPRRWHLFDFVDILGQVNNIQLKVPPLFEAVQDHPIPLPDPGPLALVDLVKRYGAQTAANVSMVEPHRFAFPHIEAAKTAIATDQQAITTTIGEWANLGLDWPGLIGILEQTKGNVAYEELDCLGLDYNREWLVGTFVIKRPSGYSGGLCEKGSQEHIAFWADWDNTCTWTYLGTVSVDIHDINPIPPDGLHYTALLPADLNAIRQPCEEPKIARVRAVLSWSSLPSTTNPDAIPYWGNRLDAHVQIKPGRRGSLEPDITVLGGINVQDIDGGTGLTTPTATFAEWGTDADVNSLGRPCPFGGFVNIQAVAPDAFAALGYKYRVLTREFGTLTEIPVLSSFPVTSAMFSTTTRTPDPLTGYLPYLPPAQNVFSMLGRWYTSGDALWEIRLEVVDAFNNFVGTTPWYRLQLDNTAPTADIHITSGGDCADFGVNSVLTGTFQASDTHFGFFELDTLPNSMTPPDPTPGSSTTLPTLAGTWTLNTAGMQPCGYVIVLRVRDRTIVHSNPAYRNGKDADVGFCIS